MLSRGLWLGGGVLLLLLAFFALARLVGQSYYAARAVMFAALVLSSIGLIQVNRNWGMLPSGMLGSANPYFAWMLVATLALLAAVLAVPPVRSLFAFSMPDLRLALVGAAASVLCVGWCEWTRRRLQGRALRRP